MLALAAPAQAGRENPACERYAQDIKQAKEVADATPPARKAAGSSRARRALKNAEGEQGEEGGPGEGAQGQEGAQAHEGSA